MRYIYTVSNIVFLLLNRDHTALLLLVLLFDLLVLFICLLSSHLLSSISLGNWSFQVLLGIKFCPLIACNIQYFKLIKVDKCIF